MFRFLPAYLVFCLSAVSVFTFQNCENNDTPARILVFSKTEGYRHDCIPTGVAALRKLCHDNGIAMDTSEDAEDFNEKNLNVMLRWFSSAQRAMY